MGSMSVLRWSGVTLLAAVTAVVACSVHEPSGSGLAGVFVHGRVSTEADSSVADARITLGWRPMSTCTATFPVSDSAPSTDAGGLYGVLLVDTTAAEAVCIKVIATPPAGHPLVAESTVVGNVVLSPALWDDSVRIDVVLPPP